MIEEELTNKIIGASIEVHKHLGKGLLESAYRACLCHELRLRDLLVEQEVPLKLEYKGLFLDCAYKLDVVVEKKVIIELKSIEKLLAIHEAQLISYLKLSKIRVGLLINFNVERLMDGLKRRVV